MHRPPEQAAATAALIFVRGKFIDPDTVEHDQLGASCPAAHCWFPEAVTLTSASRGSRQSRGIVW